jgi:trk system potassium uptake protein TrkA
MFTIIIGGGQVGNYLASLLLRENHQIMIVENRKERLNS